MEARSILISVLAWEAGPVNALHSALEFDVHQLRVQHVVIVQLSRSRDPWDRLLARSG
jgi:hypothetical protein